MPVADDGDGSLHLGPGTEGGRRDIGLRPREPAQRVLLVVGALKHPGRYFWVRSLEQQGADGADEHRSVADYGPGR